MNEYKVFIGSKVIKVNGTDLYFDNGKVISFHKYETYIESYDSNNDKIELEDMYFCKNCNTDEYCDFDLFENKNGDKYNASICTKCRKFIWKEEC